MTGRTTIDSRCRVGAPLVLATVAAGLCCLGAANRPAAADDPVFEVAKGLRGAGPMPWYDPETDTLRRVDVPVTEAPSGPQTAEPRPQSGRRAGRGALSGQLAEMLAWTVLLGLLTLIVAAMAGAIRRGSWDTSRGPGSRPQTPAGHADWLRVEQLPVPLQRTTSSLLDETRRLYSLGHYSQAIVFLFGYQLLQLDKAQMILLARGKTNRQYLRELVPHADVRKLVIPTMRAFEDAFFGHHACSRARFEACWRRLDEFHQRLGIRMP
jgi:hypothetical protein